MPKFDESENEIKYRIKDPAMFVQDSFRSRNLDDGIRLILGKMKDDPSKMIPQSLAFAKPDFDKDKAKMWVDEHENDFAHREEPILHKIKGIEVFSVGEWNGNKITSKDLDDMVAAFEANKETILPHVKLGHTKDQKLIQSDGLPVGGWIGRLYRQGDKLFADLVDIPHKIFKAILGRSYKKVSLEVYHNIKIAGNMYRRMVGAVSLLGQDLPGVQNLSDILANYKSFEEIKTFSENISEVTLEEYVFENVTEDEKMSKELEQKLADMEAKLETYAAEKEELEESKKELAELKEYKAQAEEKAKADKQKLEEVLAEKAERELDLAVSEFVQAGLITKAQESMAKALLGPEKEEYAMGDKKVGKKELLKEYTKLAISRSEVNFEDSSKEAEKLAHDEKMDKEIKEYMAEHKASYKDAVAAVISKYESKDVE